MKMHAFVSREMDSTVMLTEWKRYDFNMQIKKNRRNDQREKWQIPILLANKNRLRVLIRR